MNWTDERIETLKKLLKDGLSATQIATQLGGVSRNAVLGKVHRLGLHLTGDQGQPKAVPLVRAPRVRKSVPDPKAIAELHKIIDRAPPPVVEKVAAPKSLGLSLMDLQRNDCRWPAGEREHITFCGHAIEAGKPYCPYHVRLARGRGTESERTAARALERAA
jgi:GcrA cell cycle regulator